jgi:hypothetical protein
VMSAAKACFNDFMALFLCFVQTNDGITPTRDKSLKNLSTTRGIQDQTPGRAKD